jgi:hypothetical protein
MDTDYMANVLEQAFDALHSIGICLLHDTYNAVFLLH